jgi:transposase
MRRIPEKTIKNIIKLRKQKLTLPVISKRLNVAKSTISKYSKEAGLTAIENVGGRPKKLSLEMRKAIFSEFSKNNCKNLVDGKLLVENKFNIQCSRQTVKRALNGKGLKCFIKSKKPFLSEIHKEKRTLFAKNFFNFSFFDWKKVIWSDECKFALSNTNRREFYWKHRTDSLKEQHIKKTLKFGGGSILAWGCITSEGVGELIRIDGIMDANKYVSILSNGLLKTMENYGLDTNKVIFMHDNDPKHTAKKTKEWLYVNKINCLAWPPQSPDMNPIENLWDIIDRKIRKRKERCSNKEELWEMIKWEWYNLDKDIIRNLYLSMTQRINDLKKNKGGYTKW